MSNNMRSNTHSNSNTPNQLEHELDVLDGSFDTDGDVTNHTSFDDEHDIDLHVNNTDTVPRESSLAYSTAYAQSRKHSHSLRSMPSERTNIAVLSAVNHALSKDTNTISTTETADHEEQSANKALQDEMSAADHTDPTEYVSIHDDVYNMFFLSNIGGQAFFYTAYVFSLKISLFTFLALDVLDSSIVTENKASGGEAKVLAAQCLMLPVAVAMQEDLIATYYLIGNIKYCATVRLRSPDARKWKYHTANIARGIDGMYSLLVNFVVLLRADDILTLFLNFAALQFLQTIDNIALQLAASGFLTERLETVALTVKDTKLPKKNSKFYKRLDTFLFLTTTAVLLIAWVVIIFIDDQPASAQIVV